MSGRGTMYGRILELARHSVVYGIGSIASKVLAIILLPLYVRYLEPRAYGVAEAVLMIDLFAAAVFRLGLQNSMMRFYYDRGEHGDDVERAQRERGERVVRTTLSISLLSTGIGVILLVVLARPLAEFFLHSAKLERFIWISAFGLWTSVVYSTITATFRLQKRPVAFSVLSLINVVLTAGLTVVFVTDLHWGAVGLLMGNFLASFVLIPVAAVMQGRMVVPRIDRSLVKPMLLFGIPTMPIAIANQGLTLIDRTVLARTVGLTELGLYAVASRIAQVVMLVVIALQLSWQPFAYGIRDDDEARRAYSLVMSWFCAVMGWLVAGMALVADPAIRVLTVPRYFAAAQAVPLLALAAGVYGAYFLVGIGASRVKKTGYHAVVAAAALVMSLVANVVLVPRIGFVGAAIAAVLANGVLAGAMMVRSQQVFRVDYELGRIARAVVLMAAALVAAYLLPTGTSPESWVPRVTLALLWPVALVATGFVRAEERVRIVKLVRRRASNG